MKRVNYFAKAEKTGTGYSVYFKDFEGCITCGETLQEAVKNADEALNLHIQGII